MTELDRERFARLCAEDRVLCTHDGDSIGTYSEKRLHRIIKRYITEDADLYEVKIGKHVADVLDGNVISEIQTGSFLPLVKKIEYYLESTEHKVRIVCPVIENKMLIRADRATGEIRSCRCSPKHGSDLDVLVKMYPLAHLAADPRLTLCVLHVNAEEYRYSEARRYDRRGRYDNDLCPCELVGVSEFNSISDHLTLLPPELLGKSFTASELSALTSLKGRALYSVLNFFVRCGVLDVKKQGKTNIYSKK